MNVFTERLSLLRDAMKRTDTDAYIIPSTDPHLGENVPDHWRIIEWLTGFSGSAATLVITEKFAGLWTDSRYFIQAEEQLHDTGFVLVKSVPSEKNDYFCWIADNLESGKKLGLDGSIFSIAIIKRIKKSFENRDISLDFECDLLSDLWEERPSLPQSVVFDHPVAFCGRDRTSKIAAVREKMKSDNIDFHLLTSPEDIMWLLNIRGKDFKYSPLIISFAIIGQEQILLFADESKFTLKIASEFDKLGIVILPYEEAEGMISTLSPDSSILLNPITTSVKLYNALPQGIRIYEGISIPTQLKAVKNSIEIENIRKAMVKDGVALVKFFHWVEQFYGTEKFSELSLGEKLNSLRAGNENYLSPSFSPIVAFNEHGALPHYSATSRSDVNIDGRGILLVDSGGQYMDGTTDITRTITIGDPGQQQKRDFTLVLKSMIGLAMAKFPYGTKGYQLDILARKSLWEDGLNYGHGTGHGVGFCLNVHEGPQSISPGMSPETRTIIEPGMLISDEPAVYREGEYGIRIENLILCCEDKETEFGKFLKFETVSLCYIDKALIDISLLEQREIDWVNSYHAEVYEKLSPFLTEIEKKWLKEKTTVLK